ncbi:hypothetical protein KI387_023191, partial [Taxus chinensis]
LENLDLRENENGKKENYEGKVWDAGKLDDPGEKFQDEIQKDDNEFAKLSDKDKEISDIVQRIQILDNCSINQEIKDANKAAAVEEAQVGKSKCLNEMPVQIDMISELSLTNDEKQVVVEAILVEIEEKVIPDEDGKKNDLIQQQYSYTTDINETFN